MKKKNFKSLQLNKNAVSNLEGTVKGGRVVALGSGNMLCVDPVETYDKACSNHMCDSRLGGCPSYYCG